MIEIKLEKYFVIDKDIHIHEYISLESAKIVENRLLVFVYQKKFDSFIKKYFVDIKFLRPEGDEFEETIKFGNWESLIKVHCDFEKDSSLLITYKFCGPDGLVKEIHPKRGYRLNDIVYPIKKLMELSDFKSWTEYDLFEENKRLQKENEILRNELSKLQINNI